MRQLTVEEQLAQVNEAIAAIEIGGQEYQIGSRRLKRADLSLLYKRQAELQSMTVDQCGNSTLLGGAHVAIFDGR